MPKLESNVNSQQDLNSGDIFILRDKNDDLITILMFVNTSPLSSNLIDLNSGTQFMPLNFNYDNVENTIKKIIKQSDK